MTSSTHYIIKARLVGTIGLHGGVVYSMHGQDKCFTRNSFKCDDYYKYAEGC